MAPVSFPIDRRTQRRRRVITLITVFGLLGYVIYFWLGDAIARQITVHTGFSAEEAALRARTFVVNQGHAVAEHPFGAYEWQDEHAYRYMERTVGAHAARDLIESGQLPIMYWDARGQGRDGDFFEVRVSFTGTVIGYSIYGPVTHAQPALSLADSQRAAEEHLAQIGWNLSGWQLITPVLTTTLTTTSTQYNFVWQWPGQGWSKQLRLAADVTGDQMASFRYYLKVPDDFTYDSPFIGRYVADTARDLSRLVFLLAAGLIYYRALRHGGLPWERDGRVFLGALALALVMNFSSELQMLAQYNFQADPFGWVRAIIYYLNDAAFAAVGVFVLWKGGTLLCRQVWPRQNKILPGQGNGWLAFRQAYWRGLMLAGLSLAYVAIFLLVARLVFNAGIPTRVQLEQQIHSGVIAALVSPVYAWSSALWAGLSEELMFRFVGITLLLYLFRNKLIALVVPAALWAICHLFYARDPFYLRGIELLIAGVLLEGLFFLYFDLTTVIVGHFVYNVAVGELLNAKAADPFKLGVVILMVVGLLTPLAIAWIMARRTQRQQQARQPTGPPPYLMLARSNDAAALTDFPVLPIDGSWHSVLGQPDCVVAALKSGDDWIGAAYGLIDQNGLGQLRYVYVLPEWRRRGWGTALADKVSRHLQHRGAQQITAFPVKDNNRITQTFLFKLGFNARGQAYDLHPPHPFRWRRKSYTN